MRCFQGLDGQKNVSEIGQRYIIYRQSLLFIRLKYFFPWKSTFIGEKKEKWNKKFVWSKKFSTFILDRGCFLKIQGTISGHLLSAL